MGLFQKFFGSEEKAPDKPGFFKGSNKRITVSVVLAQDYAKKRDLPALVGLSTYSEVNVRKAVVNGLAEIGGPEAVASLLTMFEQDPDGGVQQLAAERLAGAGDFEPAKKLLREGSPEAQSRAAKLLLAAGPDGFAAVNAALVGNAPGVAVRILRVLQMHFRLNSDEENTKLRQELAPLVPSLIGLIERAELQSGVKACTEEVAATVSMLGQIRNPAAVPALERLAARLKERIEHDGVKRELVGGLVKDTYVTSLDEVKQVTGAIVSCGGKE